MALRNSLRTRSLVLKHRLWANPLLRALVLEFLWATSAVWRCLLLRTRVAVVTGSLGKTTAKELLSEILSTRGSTVATLHNQNDRFGVPRTLLRIRPWHRFAVIEIGVGRPGQMHRFARLVKPDVAVFLCVEGTHTTAFRDLDQHAEEKGALLNGLSPDGICVANADDPRTARIANRWKGCKILYGRGPMAQLQVTGLHSVWPDRLRFRLEFQGETYSVQTQLMGEHWVSSVLGALGAAVASHVPIRQAVAAVERVAPFPGRLQAVPLASGATVLRDDYNASWAALRAGLEVLRRSIAGRRILVLSDFSDFNGNRKARLRHLSRNLFNAADLVVLIGRDAEYARRRFSEIGPEGARVSCCRTIFDAVKLLESTLIEGDLVLLKGRTTDHVARVFFGLRGRVKCRRDPCARTVLCDYCPELGFSAAKPPAGLQEKGGPP